MKIILLALVTVLTSCCQSFNDQACVTCYRRYEFVQDGSTPPADMPALIHAAEAHGCDVRGHWTWTDDPWKSPWWTPENPAWRSGEVWWDGCGPTYKVWKRGDSVCPTSAGHELGHWCTQTESPDEKPSDDYSAMLYKDIGCPGY